MNAISFNFGCAGHLAVLATAGLLSVLSAAAPVSRHSLHKQVEELIVRCGELPGNAAMGQATQRDDKAKKPPANPMVERITQRNVFSPPPATTPRQFQVKLVGVLGDEALFEGSGPVKAGGMIDGWRLTRIGPDCVEVEQGGRTMTLQVFSPSAGPPAGRPAGPAGAGPVAVGMGPSPSQPAGPTNIEITPEIIERFRAMPPEVRQKAMEQLPPEMREKLLSSL